MTGDGGHVHDHARLLVRLRHLSDEFADDEGGAGEVHADDLVPLSRRQLGDGARRAVLFHQEPVTQDACVVDEAVQSAELLVRPADERRDVRLVGDVELPAGDPGGERRELLLGDVTDGDFGAGFVQSLGEVRPHSLGAAGDDDLELV